MKKVTRILTSGIAAIMAVSAMGMSAFANASTEAYVSETQQIDYSIYDDDMVYIPEHAEMLEQLDGNKLRSTTYTPWEWNNGIFSFATNSSISGVTFPYVFTPINNYLYFNVEIENCSTVPYLGVRKYEDGNLTYVGSYNITSNGGTSYLWENKKRTLNAGTGYVFAILSNSGWSYISTDIYHSSL